MVSEGDSAVDEFLSALYTPPNEVDLRPEFDPWLDRLRGGATSVLPVRGGGTLTFYALTPDAPAGRGMAEELLAAIGPSWSDFEGAPAELDADDPIEERILKRGETVAPGPVLRLVVRDRCDKPAWDALERLRDAWSRRPVPSDADVLLAPLQDVLRDIELTLETSAIDEAARLLDILRRRGELDSRNLLFLDLRLLAASGNWSDVLRHPRLDDVLDARRPIGVTAMLFEALNARYFASVAAKGDAGEALRIYEAEVAQRYERLVAQAADVESTAALQVRLLAAVAGDATREQTTELAARGESRARPWLESLAALAPETKPSEAGARETGEASAPGSAVDAARDALLSGSHAAALDLVADEPASSVVLEVTLSAALAVDTPAAALAVERVFEQLDATQQESLLGHPLVGGPLKQTLAMASAGESVATWSQWLARLAAGEPFEEALAIAEAGAIEWSVDEPADAEDAANLADALTSVPAHGRKVLEQALPHLLAYLGRRPGPDELALPILGAVLTVLAYGDSRTRAVRESILSVLEGLLDGSPEADAYEEIMESIETVWADVRAPRTLSWLADVLALLIAYSCPLPGRRDALIGVALNDALAFREVDPNDVDLLEVLATDPVVGETFAAELPELTAPAADAAETEPEIAPLDVGPVTVGIYTLSPTAAKQAVAVLARRYPGVEFELNAEKGGSPRLRGFAQRADVLAVVVASAKHAATSFIRQHCRPGTIIEIGTKGSTSLIRAISARLDEIAAT